jgi:hypothetical protein
MACGNLSPSPSFWAAFPNAGKAVFSRTGKGFDMRFFAVLNKDGGTLRTTDLDALRSRMEQTLEAATAWISTSSPATPCPVRSMRLSPDAAWMSSSQGEATELSRRLPHA